MKQRSIKDYIRESFIKYSAIVILLIFVVFLFSLYFIFKSSVSNANKTLNRLIVSEIEQGTLHYQEEIIKWKNNHHVKEFLQSGEQMGDTVESLYNLKNSGIFNANFILLDAKKNILSSSLPQDVRSELINRYMFGNLIEQLDQELYVKKSISSLYPTTEKSMYFFGTKIEDESETIGYLLYFIEGLAVEHKYNQTIYITDQFDNIIFSMNGLKDTTLGKLPINTDEKIKKINNDYFYISYDESFDQSMRVLTMTSINTYRNLLIYGLLAMSIVSVVIILVVYLVSPKIFEKTLQPLDVLVSLISKDQGDYGDVDKFNEFQTIYKEYNSKIKEIQTLLSVNKEIMEKKRQMEIKHLEAKFNPHFLYNTLEMLKYEITLNPENASEIVVKIANLMRYNTNFGSTTVPLHIDISNLHDYISLQKMRYGDRLSFSSEIDRDLLPIHIPKLIIQPLIENAIKHNIQHVFDLSINLIIKQIDCHIVIEVIDNGIGIEAGKLKKLQDFINSDHENWEHNGLRNTHKIIQLLYGDTYGLEIYSQINKQTKVRIIIPYTEVNALV